MNKVIITVAIGLGVFSVIFRAYFFFASRSYVASSNRDDHCKTIYDRPKKVVIDILDRRDACRIAGRGSFKDTAFIYLACKPEEGSSFKEFIFGSKEACDSFRKLNSAEYIKLILQNMPPSNEPPKLRQ